MRRLKKVPKTDADGSLTRAEYVVGQVAARSPETEEDSLAIAREEEATWKAMFDAENATVSQKQLVDWTLGYVLATKTFFSKADKDRDGALSRGELTDIRPDHLSEHLHTLLGLHTEL